MDSPRPTTVSLVLAGCLILGTACAGGVSATSATILALPAEPAVATPILTLDSLIGATPAEVQMVERAFILANRTLASTCFRSKLIAEEMTETLQLSPQEVYRRLTGSPQRLNVRLYTGNLWRNYVTRTIGYENESDSTTVHMNRHFVDTDVMAAGNLVHEMAHGRGFRHDHDKSSSVPYTVDRVFEACGTPQRAGPSTH
jgi:hypothetical protein